jgi:hypothetical protein
MTSIFELAKTETLSVLTGNGIKPVTEDNCESNVAFTVNPFDQIILDEITVVKAIKTEKPSKAVKAIKTEKPSKAVKTEKPTFILTKELKQRYIQQWNKKMKLQKLLYNAPLHQKPVKSAHKPTNRVTIGNSPCIKGFPMVEAAKVFSNLKRE